jgi:hypothetical protein
MTREVTDERVETLIEAPDNAFLAFGGTPREVLYDNMRTIVLGLHGYGSVATDSIPASSISPAIAVSVRGCEHRAAASGQKGITSEKRIGGALERGDVDALHDRTRFQGPLNPPPRRPGANV